MKGKKVSDKFLEIYNSIRKKMPKPSKVIRPDKEYSRKWDWRKEINNKE